MGSRRHALSWLLNGMTDEKLGWGVGRSVKIEKSSGLRMMEKWWWAFDSEELPTPILWVMT